ncbi:sporulation protein YunB [Caldicellulosiruptoraceae bacterium PP1]
MAFILIFLIIVFTVLSYYIENKFEEVFVIKSKGIVTEIINNQILNLINANNISYDQFVISKSTNNGIDIVTIDNLKINKIISQLILNINKKLNQLYPIKIKLKFGYFFSNVFFIDMGPEITAQIISINIISPKVKSEFLSAGINQTIHRLNLDLNVECVLLLSHSKKKTTYNQKIPLVEQVYIGKIPTIYFNK